MKTFRQLKEDFNNIPEKRLDDIARVYVGYELLPITLHQFSNNHKFAFFTQLPEKEESIKIQFKDFDTLQAVNYVVQERLGLETTTESTDGYFVLTITDFDSSLPS